MNLKNNNFHFPFLNIVIFLFLLAGCNNKEQEISISSEIESPKIQFAIDEIKASFAERGISALVGENENADIVFSIQPEDTELKPEGFSIKKESKKIVVTGADNAGAMYGGLELAEQISLYGLNGIQETTQNPYMELRGTKFNIPLDLRTPSYTDAGDAGQKNISEMWNFDFWKEYIDNLARYRYNRISLWNLHPFPSMVRVPDYPDVALDDVQRSSSNWDEYCDLNGMGFDAPKILVNPEIVKKITMDEKIEFWKKVMAYGKSRNVNFYVVTWNIFVHGAKDKYGITDKIDNPITRDYFRKSVKQMFVTYPDLDGIGLTTGENMYGSSSEAKEDWAYETYAQGVLDAADAMPDRKFTFIHRQHQTGAQEIATKFKPLMDNKNIEFLFSFKYAQAHVFSATTQPFCNDFVNDIENMKTLWTLRNDDNYQFRWGAPSFVREFLTNIPHNVSRGYYYGSDQWIWGREFLMKESETPRELEVVKHWYHWMMWGRLGYNPEITNDRFTQILQNHFPEVDGSKLFKAWEEASMIYPTTTGFHWGAMDFQWNIEACKSRPVFSQNETGFHDVNRFINLPPHPTSGFQSIPDFVKMTIDGGRTELKSPFEVAQMLNQSADKAIELVGQLNEGKNKELKYTLQDIKTMALLGKYYALKIEGAANLAFFRETKEKRYQDEAISKLTEALDFWTKYTEAASVQNINPFWISRMGYVNWENLNKWVADDIDITKAG